MASRLFALGRWCYRHAWRVILAWVFALVVIGGAALALAGSFNDQFSIPSAPSQEALTKLRMTFPEASGASASAIIVPPKGTLVTDPSVRLVIEEGVTAFDKVQGVSAAISPWNEHIQGLVSSDATAAIIQVRLSMSQAHPEDLVGLDAAAAALQAKLPAGTTVTMGGEAYSIELPHFSVVEVIGVVIALVVLAFVLGSLVAAGMPILTALVGVALTAAVMFLMTRITTVNSVTPMLAVMLGLAVGIDYALFVLSRHREQLRDPGVSAEESTARSVATAGSAVVFAGLTVVIALLGLALAQIPFLTVMGVFASLGVALAVVIALTMLPALMGLAGERLRPRSVRVAMGTQGPVAETSAKRGVSRHEGPETPVEEQGEGTHAGRTRRPGRFLRAWVTTAIRWPWVTVVVIVVALGALALPATNLHLSLPNSGQHAATASDRIAYDLTTQHFGPGFNGPLIVTVDLLASTDPLGVMAGIRKDIEATPGVASVLIAVPNKNADTGFVQVIPTTAPDDVATQALVERLRAHDDAWRATHGGATAVTGMTAIQIDVSDRLAGALLPFGLFVVGLSLVLLTIVFRSIAVPIKAALGYLLSVGAAFGVTTLVFNDGWALWLANLEKPMAIISFLPILLMGILFGLAMDYEVFLVSRIREEYVHGKSARDAIVEGFVGSGRVVAAAALIMVAVFAFFVPEGMGPVKAIAFALAIGIAVDAFIVRMTLVPAVLALLGDKAWWLPKWLDKRLPSLDVEGESLARELALAQWPGTDDAVFAEALAAEPATGPLDLVVPPGGVVALHGQDERRAAMLLLAGRLAATSGRARVGGALLPEQASKVRRATVYLDPTRTASVARELSWATAHHTRVVCIDNADLLASEEDRQAVADLIASARADRDHAVLLGGANSGVLREFHPDALVAVRSFSHAN